MMCDLSIFFFFSSRRRHTRFDCDWSSDVCSSDLGTLLTGTLCANAAAPANAFIATAVPTPARSKSRRDIWKVMSVLLSDQRPGKILSPQKGAKNKNFCVSCAFLWPFLFLYTGHSTREGLISAYTYKRYYKRQPDAEEMPENVCNEDPVTWKQFRN